jgi:multiple sugar transport system ATP-binding protein
MAKIDLHQVVKRYGKVLAVRGIDLSVADGEFVVLVGPSGCGKSTTLRMIAGLEDIDGGTIAIDGRVVNRVEPKNRNIAMVFQNYAIYPHMSVAKNISFGLYASKMPEEQKRQRIAETAKLLGLEDLLDRRPAQLSGGQRQRVAIGRAMVRQPVAFLFDEPLSNLDAQLRSLMRVEIKKLHQRLGTTIVYVTHDQVEAMTMADRIVVMRDGDMLQAGAPMELYDKPADVFTAGFIGSPTMNILPGKATDGGIALDGLGVTAKPSRPARAGDVLVGIRPQELIVGDAPGAGLVLEAKVVVVEPLGSETFVHVELGGQSIVASTTSKQPPRVGSTVRLAAPAESLHLFDAKSGRALAA